jgi:hypothetical protein
VTAPFKPPLLEQPVPASLSPVDLPGDLPDVGRPLRWTAGIVATASLVLLLFNAGAIRGWADELPPAPLTEPAIAAAEAWHGLTSQIGLAAPVETMRGWWREAQDARFAAGEDQR